LGLFYINPSRRPPATSRVPGPSRGVPATLPSPAGARAPRTRRASCTMSWRIAWRSVS